MTRTTRECFIAPVIICGLWRIAGKIPNLNLDKVLYPSVLRLLLVALFSIEP